MLIHGRYEYAKKEHVVFCFTHLVHDDVALNSYRLELASNMRSILDSPKSLDVLESNPIALHLVLLKPLKYGKMIEFRELESLPDLLSIVSLNLDRNMFNFAGRKD